MRILPEGLRDRLSPRLRRLAEAYRSVFTGPDGETVLHDLLREAGVLSDGFDGDTGLMAYNEGRRSLALHILNKLRWTEPHMVALAARRADETVTNMEQE